MGDDNNDGTKCSFTEQLIMTVHMQICTTMYTTELLTVVYCKVYGLLCKVFLNSSEIAVRQLNRLNFFFSNPFITAIKHIQF